MEEEVQRRQGIGQPKNKYRMYREENRQPPGRSVPVARPSRPLMRPVSSSRTRDQQFREDGSRRQDLPGK